MSQSILNRVVNWAASYLRVSLATKLAGEDTDNDRMLVAGKYQFVNFSANVSKAVTNEGGTLGNVVVNTAAAGSIKIYNAPNADDATKLVADIDTSVRSFNKYEAGCDGGIYVVYTGTANTTLTYMPGA